MSQIWRDCKLAGQVVIRNWKKLLIPYCTIWVIVVILLAMVAPYGEMPYNNIEDIKNISSLLILVALCLGIAAWATECAVHYQLAALYKNQSASIWEGARLYMWRFLGLFLLLGLVVLPFGLLAIPGLNGKSSINGSIILLWPLSFLMEIIFNITKVSIVTNDYHVIEALSSSIKLVFKNFKYIALTVILISVIEYVGDSFNSSYNLILMTVTTIISSLVSLWIKSIYTLIFFKLEQRPLVHLTEGEEIITTV